LPQVQKRGHLEGPESCKGQDYYLNQASKHFSIPEASIYDRLHKAFERVGKPTELSPLEEDIIIQWLLLMRDGVSL
jgi:hypothetical protein